MGSVTEWVRAALAELGPDAPDAEIKAYIRDRAPQVPQSQIGLALRRLRGTTIPKGRPRSGKASTES